MTPLLTIIVCTYNRAFILEDCLDSLCAQDAPTSSFAVLIVNNNSTDNTQALAESYIGRLSGLRVVFEKEQGLSHARNRGIDETQTEWVAFLDDDAKAHPDWVATILDTIRRDDFDCFGGTYYAWHRFGSPPGWFAPEWESHVPEHPYGTLEKPYIVGGNCAFRRNMALVAGKFQTDYGMNGKNCAYGEETLLFELMRQQGVRLGFVPAMSIDHCVLPYKYTLRWRLFSAYASGRDYFRIFPASKFWSFLRLGKAVLWHLPKNFVRCCRQKFAWQRILLESINPVLSGWGGCVACFAKHPAGRIAGEQGSK